VSASRSGRFTSGESLGTHWIAQWYIALGYGLDDRGVRVPGGAGNFSLQHRVQPPIQWVPGVLSLRVKRPGREADRSPPSSTEVNNAWTIPPLLKHAFTLCGA
jgi:hypothetical protein